ncbi:ABC transporter ATP-binding protein [Marinicella sp. W31]|uniref:ABC transporter ATP-binding protein n=1 Tax=Marinicella sp. W31 TaxID=3023713 RepID=UPI003756BEAA
MTEATSNGCILELQNVHKSVHSNNGEIHILKGVDLKLKQGSSVAILGESGSGKSTLLGLCAGLDVPQQGYIHMYGQNMTQLDEDQRAQLRARETGFVFQSFYLLAELNALENIALPLELFGHPRPQHTARTWLQKLGLAERAQHMPKQLSGGEQQRVALCRAFAVKPRLLFADEPTANLDRHTAAQVVDYLFELHHESKNSMLLVTHDQSLSKRCDYTYQLKGGQLHALEY